MKGEFYKMDYEAWDEGTDALSLELEAAYLRLCHQLYRRKSAIPSAPATLGRIWRCHPNKARKLLGDLIAAGKVVEKDGHLTNTRVTRELDAREMQRTQKVDAGHTGGTRTQDNRRKALENKDEQQASASGSFKQNQAEKEGEGEKEVEKKDNPQDPNGSLAPKGATTRGHRLPADFASDPKAAETCQEWGYVGTNAENLLAEFCDHWSNEPGAKGVKLDWIKTLRNRLRQVGPFRQGRVIKGPFPPRPSQADDRADVLQALKTGGQHVSSLNNQSNFDLGPVIEHQGDGRHDRDVPRALGGGAGRLSQEGYRFVAGAERR